jgi:hypothetical protein
MADSHQLLQISDDCHDSGIEARHAVQIPYHAAYYHNVAFATDPFRASLSSAFFVVCTPGANRAFGVKFTGQRSKASPVFTAISAFCGQSQKRDGK